MASILTSSSNECTNCPKFLLLDSTLWHFHYLQITLQAGDQNFSTWGFELWGMGTDWVGWGGSGKKGQKGNYSQDAK